jgi:hypothetical protein
MTHPMDTAPRNASMDDFGPKVVLIVDGREVDGHWCSGLEMGDIWIPSGWYSDDGDEVEPTAWRPL